jgi:glycyl-tRNA synthetase beta subunit
MVDFLFGESVPATSSPAPSASIPTGLEEFYHVPVAPSSGNKDSMFGGIFGDEVADLSSVANRVQVEVESHETDTAERAALRQARAQRVQDRIDKQLKEKVDRDTAEAKERELQSDLKQKTSDRVSAWKKQSEGNIMGLLASLHTVIWEDSGWQPKSMGDLLENNGVKKAYRLAILKLHPDKVKQQHGDTETLVLADMIFDTLKEAWTKSQYS